MASQFPALRPVSRHRSHPAVGRKPGGVEVLSITAKKQERRAGDVNPPVTVPARPASGAPGADRGRTGRLTWHPDMRFDTETIVQNGLTVGSVPDSLTVAARL